MGQPGSQRAWTGQLLLYPFRSRPVAAPASGNALVCRLSATLGECVATAPPRCANVLPSKPPSRILPDFPNRPRMLVCARQINSTRDFSVGEDPILPQTGLLWGIALSS